MADSAGLERLIEPEVKSLGYELVRVKMIGGASDPTLQVMAERPDTRQLDIADCERISRHLSAMLDLAGISFIDMPGAVALRDLRRRGVQLVGCSPLVNELLKENDRRLDG